MLRLATAEFPILAIHADQGRWPDLLDDQWPDYLPIVPQDPSNDQSLCYQPRGDGSLVYSVGANGGDDGGKLVGIFPVNPTDAGDVLLDVFDIEAHAGDAPMTTDNEEVLSDEPPA